MSSFIEPGCLVSMEAWVWPTQLWYSWVWSSQDWILHSYFDFLSSGTDAISRVMIDIRLSRPAREDRHFKESQSSTNIFVNMKKPMIEAL